MFKKIEETDILKDENIELEIVATDTGILWGQAVVPGSDVPLVGW